MATPPILTIEDLELNPSAHTVERAGKRISLSAREFTLLEFLMRNGNRVMSRKSIVAHVWGDELSSNAVEVYMTYIRRKNRQGTQGQTDPNGARCGLRDPEGPLRVW